MSSIQWTEQTWNPVVGCSLKSPGCTNCYAMKMARRLELMGQAKYAGLTQVVNEKPVWTGTVRLERSALGLPLKRKAPTTWFVNSMSDLFHESLGNEEIAEVFKIICKSLRDRPREKRHTYQILTKRAERLSEWFTWAKRQYPGWFGLDGKLDLGHVWIGVSVEDQKRADERIPYLLQTPVRVRFLSMEPLLGSVDLSHWLQLGRCDSRGGGCEATGTTFRCGLPAGHGGDYHSALTPTGAPWFGLGDLHWIILGGESGPDARPCEVAWLRSLVRQCKAAGVPCFVKQMGSEWAGNIWVNGKSVRAHGDPKGGDPQWWSEDLRVREMPEVAR